MINQRNPSSAPGLRHDSFDRLDRKIRVLVVDDSVVLRRIISKTLNEDPDFEVVGFAANGIHALRKAAELKPDAITLDIEMPEMDGLKTLRKLREASSTACVIMCSTHTLRGASATIDALILGAKDYVTKPCNNRPDTAPVMLRNELIPKIKQFFERSGASLAPAPRAVAVRPQAGPELALCPPVTRTVPRLPSAR